MSPHRQFTPRKLKEHPAIAIVVRELWEQFEPTLDSRVDRKSQRQTLRELIVDFAARYIETDRDLSCSCLAIGTRRADYVKGSLFRRLFLRQSDMLRAMQFLLERGYIHVTRKARWGRVGSSRTVYAVGDALAALFDVAIASGAARQASPYMRREPEQLVEVRRPKLKVDGRKVPDHRPVKLSPEQRAAVATIQGAVLRMNVLIAGHRITSPLRGWHEPIPTPLWRVFSDGRLDRGGRWYGWHTDEHDYDRAKLEIDGEPVVELDFKAMQVVLAYEVAGFLYWTQLKLGDPYFAPAIFPNSESWDETKRKHHRKLTKAIFLRALGMEHRNLGALAHSVREGFIEQGEELPRALLRRKYIIAVAERFLAHHSRIEPLLFCGQATALQHRESQIATCILRKLAEQDIPCLPVHDSYIVRKSDEEALRRAMRESAGPAHMIEDKDAKDPRSFRQFHVKDVQEQRVM